MNKWVYFYALTYLLFFVMLLYKAYVIELHGLYFLFGAVMTVMVLIGSIISGCVMYVRLVGMMADCEWSKEGKWYVVLFETIIHSFIFAMMLGGFPLISTIGILSILGSI